MTKKVIVYIAVSNDGYIADKNGEINWLEQVNNQNNKASKNYDEFIGRCDSIAFGRKVYDQIIGWNIEWPYSNLKNYLFTNKNVNDSNINVVNGDVSIFMEKFKNKTHQKALWLMGGANLISQFFKANLIDEYIITVLETVSLGGGIKLNEYDFLKTKKPNEIIKLDDNFTQYIWYLK